MDLAVTQEQGGIVVIGAPERVDGTNARDFQSALEGAIADNTKAAILDMSGLAYISSAGLRAILLIAKSLQGRDGSLSVCSLTDSVKEVFEISGFDNVIPVRASREDAIAALN